MLQRDGWALEQGTLAAHANRRGHRTANREGNEGVPNKQRLYRFTGQLPNTLLKERQDDYGQIR